jgi:hypothetical protein
MAGAVKHMSAADLVKRIAEIERDHGKHVMRTRNFPLTSSPRRIVGHCSGCSGQFEIKYDEPYSLSGTFQQVVAHDATCGKGAARLAKRYLSDQVHIAIKSGKKPADLQTQIRQQMSVEVPIAAIRAQFRRAQRDEATLAEFQQVGSMVNSLQAAGCPAVWSTDEHGQVSFFASMIPGAREFCNSPGFTEVVTIDAAHLHTPMYGFVLIAASVTADVHFVILGVGWTPQENAETYAKFMRLLKQSGVTPRTVMSDAQKGLMNSAAEVWGPGTKEVQCLHHALGNVSAKSGSFMTAMVHAPTPDEYERLKKQFQAECPTDFENKISMVSLLSTQSGFCAYTAGQLTNNAAESENKAISEMRNKGPVTMTLGIMRIAAAQAKKQLAKLDGSLFVSAAEAQFQDAQTQSMIVLPAPGMKMDSASQYVVTEQNSACCRTVEMDWAQKKCSCNMMLRTGLPCRHMLRVGKLRNTPLETFVPDCCFQASVRAGLQGMDVTPPSGPFPVDPRVVIPIIVRGVGRHQMKRLEKGAATKRAYSCGACGSLGHRTGKCAASAEARHIYSIAKIRKRVLRKRTTRAERRLMKATRRDKLKAERAEKKKARDALRAALTGKKKITQKKR